MSYFKVLPINSVCYYRGRTLYVKAVYQTGAVLRSEGGELVCLEGAEYLKELHADA